MIQLINVIKKLEKILLSLEIIMHEEYQVLSNINMKIDTLKNIVQKKEYFLKDFLKLNQERIFFEKKYNIFAPYPNHFELKRYSDIFLEKSYLLKKINIKNKILLNKKFYFNQHFLELFLSSQKCITYNINGNLEF